MKTTYFICAEFGQRVKTRGFFHDTDFFDGRNREHEDIGFLRNFRLLLCKHLVKENNLLLRVKIENTNCNIQANIKGNPTAKLEN